MSSTGAIEPLLSIPFLTGRPFWHYSNDLSLPSKVSQNQLRRANFCYKENPLPLPNETKPSTQTKAPGFTPNPTLLLEFEASDWGNQRTTGPPKPGLSAPPYSGQVKHCSLLRPHSHKSSKVTSLLATTRLSPFPIGFSATTTLPLSETPTSFPGKWAAWETVPPPPRTALFVPTWPLPDAPYSRKAAPRYNRARTSGTASLSSRWSIYSAGPPWWTPSWEPVRCQTAHWNERRPRVRDGGIWQLERREQKNARAPAMGEARVRQRDKRRRGRQGSHSRKNNSRD